MVTPVNRNQAGVAGETEALRHRYQKKDRLSKRPEYLQLAEEGQRLFSRYFIVVYAAGQHPDSRLGITVTKKIGPAVIRNRIKRVCREFFRTHREQLDAVVDIHIIARRAATQAANNELTNCLEKLFAQIV
jgi:ribonuclease P protein component